MSRIILGAIAAIAVSLYAADEASAQFYGGGYGFRYSSPGISIGFGSSRGYGKYGSLYGNRSYYRGRGSNYIWHDTSHYDYHPPSLYPHGNHFHYAPGHYDYHRSGHFDSIYGHGHHGHGHGHGHFGHH